MNDREIRYTQHRIYYLPTAIENARRKLAALEREAERYGMRELLSPSDMDRAWDRSVQSAQCQSIINLGENNGTDTN